MTPDLPTAALPPWPQVEGAEVLRCTGGRWPDGWTTAQLRLQCRAIQAAAGLTLRAWNPDWTAAYAGNVVCLTLAEASVRSGPLAMGESFSLWLPRPLAAGETFELTLGSAVCRPPDALEDRERALVLNALALRPVGAPPA
jgi:hypothetical protein